MDLAPDHDQLAASAAPRPRRRVEPLGGPQQQRRVTHRIGGRDQQQLASRGRQGIELRGESALDASDQGRTSANP
jgi:hypothetical protein